MNFVAQRRSGHTSHELYFPAACIWVTPGVSLGIPHRGGRHARSPAYLRRHGENVRLAFGIGNGVFFLCVTIACGWVALKGFSCICSANLGGIRPPRVHVLLWLLWLLLLVLVLVLVLVLLVLLLLLLLLLLLVVVAVVVALLWCGGVSWYVCGLHPCEVRLPCQWAGQVIVVLDTVHISPPYTVENVAGTAGAGDTLARVKQMVRSLAWAPTDQSCGGSGAQPQAVAGVFLCVRVQCHSELPSKSTGYP
jgi:hypothetical protein